MVHMKRWPRLAARRAVLTGLAWTVGLVLSWACAKVPQVAAPPPPHEPSLGPLIELVPPGPELVLLARPEQLARAEGPRALFRALVTEEREQAFRERTGVDPRTLSELVVFEVGQGGYVLLVRGPFDAQRAVAAAGERLAIVDVSTDAPRMRREGLAGKGRYSYAALDAHALLVAKDAAPALVQTILHRIDDTRAPRLLDGADGAALYADHVAAPLLLLAPRPLALEPSTPTAVVLAEERALAVAITPEGRSLWVTVDLRGAFPAGVEHNLRTLGASLGRSELGSVLGFSGVSERMGIRVDPEGVFVRFDLDSAEVIRGVRVLFFEEMREIFP